MGNGLVKVGQVPETLARGIDIFAQYQDIPRRERKRHNLQAANKARFSTRQTQVIQGQDHSRSKPSEIHIIHPTIHDSTLPRLDLTADKVAPTPRTRAWRCVPCLILPRQPCPFTLRLWLLQFRQNPSERAGHLLQPDQDFECPGAALEHAPPRSLELGVGWRQ